MRMSLLILAFCHKLSVNVTFLLCDHKGTHDQRVSWLGTWGVSRDYIGVAGELWDMGHYWGRCGRTGYFMGRWRWLGIGEKTFCVGGLGVSECNVGSIPLKLFWNLLR